jgi:hypothetical protein
MKWALLQNDDKRAMASGYCTPYPIEVGKSVWVGSLTSRDGWTTTPVQSIFNNGRSFKTRNNTYHIVPVDEYYGTIKNGDPFPRGE